MSVRCHLANVTEIPSLYRETCSKSYDDSKIKSKYKDSYCYFILQTSNKDYNTTLEKNSKYLLPIGLN